MKSLHVIKGTPHIKRNSTFAFLSQLIRIVTTFVLFVGIARFYGIEAFGQFTTAHSIATIFLLFADFGFDMLLPTEIARHRKSPTRFVQEFFSLKIVFAGLATLAMVVLALAKEFTVETRILVLIFSSYVLVASINTFFFALFKGFEEFQHETRISFFNNLALLLLLLLLGLLEAPVYWVALSFIGTRVLGIASSLRVASKLSSIKKWSLSFDGWRDTWRNVGVFGLHYIFGNLFFQVDTLLLAFLRGDRDVGLYQSVFKIATLALIIPDVAVTTMMPVLSRLHSEDNGRWLVLGRLLQRSLFLVSLPVSIVLFLYPEQIIELIYGLTGFAEAVPILRIFSVIVFVRFGVDAYALMITTSRHQSKRMAIVIIGTFLSLVLNSYMIPAYGIWGAAIVSLFTNTAVAIGYIVKSQVSFREWSLDWRSVTPLLLIIPASLILWSVKTVPALVTIPLILGFSFVVIYFVGYTEIERRLIFDLRTSLPSRKSS